ncbi:MAG: hypothetical protein CL916_03270 [Deltaproteobacteria bacterium]|nr:hypothetical protein [Deltaproteobacteria bacterium]
MKFLLVAFGFALCTCILLSPEVIFDPERVIGKETRDLYDHLALLDLWSIQADKWSFPTGGSLVPPDIFSMLFSVPFMGMGRGVAFDIALWIQLWLCCMGGYSVGKHVGSGVVGGVAFGFSPFVLGQLYTGETETMNGWTLAFLLSAYIHNPRSLWVGLWLTLTSLGSWYYGMYACICWFFATLWRFFSDDWDRRLLYPIYVFFGCIAIPVVLYSYILLEPDQMFRGPTMSDYLDVNPRALASFSVDLAAWFGHERVDAGHDDRLSLTIVLLSCMGIVSLIKEKYCGWKIIVILLVGTLMLSLGPILHWKSEPFFSWMPYRIFAELPVLSLMRLPHRWLVVSSLIFAFLASRGGRGLAFLWCVLISFEGLYMNHQGRFSVGIQAPSIIDLYDGPVLELPSRTMKGDLRGKYLLWQREHQHATAYSLLMQGWSPALDNEPLFIAVTSVDRHDPISVRTVEASQFRKGEFAQSVQDWQRAPEWSTLYKSGFRLRKMGFSKVVLFRAAMHEQDALEAQRIIEAALGVPFIEEEGVVVWNL